MTDNKDLRAMLAIPPNFFSMSTGLAGLAGVWRLGAKLYELPALIGNGLYWLTSILFAFLVLAFVIKLMVQPRQVWADLAHPVQGPFYALLPVSGMLLAQGFLPTAQPAATLLFFSFFGMALLLGGWMTGQWIAGGLDVDVLHPAYIIPTITSGLVAAEGAARFGSPAMGWMSFGVGVLSFLILYPFILYRLFRSRLPTPLIPTLAILMSPPIVAGNAYFALSNDAADGFAFGLAGGALLMALMQVRFLPIYRRLTFTHGFWAFTFPCAAAATFAIRWLNLLLPENDEALGLGILAGLTLLIGGIAVRSIVSRCQALKQS